MATDSLCMALAEQWPCTVGMLEWCQVTMAGYAAAAQVFVWSFRTMPTCSPQSST